MSKEIQVIPLPKEFERVDHGLRSRTMTGKEASQIIFETRRKLGPPWQWKSWKRARAKVLGTECATCGAGKEAVLYVQHTFRNPRVKPYIERARDEAAQLPPQPDPRPDLYQEYLAIQQAAEPEMRDCCPECGSLSIQYRKGAATWICNRPVPGGYCGHVFSQPAKKPALTAKQRKEIKAQKYEAWRRTLLNREDDWMRDAMLAWITDMRRYLSLRDTKTLCKRCAFLEDMTDAKPCPVCGFAYPRHEDVCPDCGERNETEA
jgi:hypothetical protein